MLDPDNPGGTPSMARVEIAAPGASEALDSRPEPADLVNAPILAQA